MKNDFIFASGLWLGEGKISFSASNEFIKFYTKWEIVEESLGCMIAKQMIELHNIEEEQTVNTYTFKEIQPHSFIVILENEIVGSVTGKGIRDEETIAWEFRHPSAIEGFEVYERQDNGDFFFHAEYGSSSPYRTKIEGLIWSKNLL